MNWQRGDVVLCRVPIPSTELKQFKIRPAIIVYSDRLNQISADVMVVPCTSNTSRTLTSTQYLITGDEISAIGIRVESIIRCESVFTLNQPMILRKLGCLKLETIEQVGQCLRSALQL